ncbi:MAG: hypothetical protein R3A10_06245 [Caldilineaceae bacterium]
MNQTLIWLGGFYTLGGVILILSTMGQKISYINEVRSRTQMVNIFGKLPHHVWILQDGVEIEIPFTPTASGRRTDHPRRTDDSHRRCDHRRVRLCRPASPHR